MPDLFDSCVPTSTAPVSAGLPVPAVTTPKVDALRVSGEIASSPLRDRLTLRT